MSMHADSREFEQFARPHAAAALRLDRTPVREHDEPAELEPILEAKPDPGPSPEAHLLEACDEELVRVALKRLPSLHREVLVLREMEDCSYRDIASIPDVPIGTVMFRLSRARRQLVKELLGDPRSKV
ncbi:MAG TPA: sigma factor-like helix-turn-helix DNA-binding protein [Myxococcaceae bacterium]